MSENKRRGLGRGLGALIPTGTPATKPTGDRPVDVFFPDRGDDGSVATAVRTETDSDAKSTESTVPAEAKAAPAAPASPAPKAPAPAAAAPVQAPAAHSTVPTRGPSGLPTGGITEALTRTVSAPAPVDAAPATPAPAIPVTTQAPPARPAAAAPPAGADEVELVPVPGARFEELPVDSIQANAKQPRTVFDEDAMAELVHSVREIGVLQPIVVRQISGQGADARYELIMGERRLRASRKAGLERIPAIVRETGDDVMLRDALLENLHRSQLNPLEEAAAYQQLLDDFGCTHEDLATRIGRSRPQISNTIRLLRLPPAVQRRVAAGVLSAGHARALLGLDDHESMDRLAQRIVAEGLSVRATEETVALNDGAGAGKPRKRPRPGTHHSELDDLAARLADRLDTRVSVALGRTKGKLGIEFASVEDLNRILDILAPGLRGAFRD